MRKVHNSKEVAQYTLDGKIIRTYISCSEAGRQITGKSHDGCQIAAVCRFLRTKAFGYRWLFATDMDRAEELFNEHPVCLRHETYTVEDILKEAEKYPSKAEFMKKGGSGEYFYNAATRLGILDLLPFERQLNPHSDNLFCVYAYEFIDHSAYVGITWKKNERAKAHRTDNKSQVKRHSMETGLEVPEPIYLLENLNGKEALIQEDAYRRKYEEDGWDVLNKAKTGIKSGSLGASHGVYSRKQLREAIKKYNTLKEFREKESGLYDFARREGLVEEMCGLERGRALKSIYNEEGCFFTALKYDNVQDFQKNDWGAYAAASHHGWLNSYFWLRGRRKHGVILSNPITTFNDFEIVAFSTVREAVDFVGLKPKVASFNQLQRMAVLRGFCFYSLA